MLPPGDVHKHYVLHLTFKHPDIGTLNVVPSTAPLENFWSDFEMMNETSSIFEALHDAIDDAIGPARNIAGMTNKPHHRRRMKFAPGTASPAAAPACSRLSPPEWSCAPTAQNSTTSLLPSVHSLQGCFNVTGHRAYRWSSGLYPAPCTAWVQGCSQGNNEALGRVEVQFGTVGGSD